MLIDSTKCSSLVHEHNFSQQLDALHSKYARMSDVQAAFDFAIARTPLDWCRVDGETEYFVFRTTPVAETPSFWVLYHVESGCEQMETVSLVSIAVAEESDEED